VCAQGSKVAVSAEVLAHTGLIYGTIRHPGQVSVVGLVSGATAAATLASFADPWPDERFVSFAVCPDRTFVVFTGSTSMRAVGADGRQRWEYPYLRPLTDTTRGSAIVTADGTRVWATIPAEATSDGFDHWLVLDSRHGTVLAQTPIEAVGAGAEHFRHPDGVHVGLDVGEGQDGSVLFWGRIEHGQLHHWQPGNGLVLAGLSPTGDRYLTIAHDQSVAAVYTFPAGDALWMAPGDLAPRPPHEDQEELFWDYHGGFVDDATIILSDVEFDEQNRAGHWLIDAAAGHNRGEVSYPGPVTGYPRPLGDGTWLTATEQTISRWTIR